MTDMVSKMVFAHDDMINLRTSPGSCDNGAGRWSSKRDLAMWQGVNETHKLVEAA